MSDRITETLQALAPDTERLPVEGSSDVRRRGERRSRHQALASAAAVAMLVAGIAGISAGLSDDRRAVEGPPADPTPTAGPTFSATEEPLPRVASAPFLRPADLTGLGGYDDIGPFVDARQEPDVLARECRVRPRGWDAEDVQATRFFQDGSEASASQYVLRFADPAAAEQATLKWAYADLADCITAVEPSEGEASTRLSVVVPGFGGPRPRAIRHSRLFVPAAASEPDYYEVATAATANVVVVLEWQAWANPSGGGADAWVWSAERLQVALDRAVGNEP